MRSFSRIYIILRMYNTMLYTHYRLAQIIIDARVLRRLHITLLHNEYRSVGATDIALVRAEDGHYIPLRLVHFVRIIMHKQYKSRPWDRKRMYIAYKYVAPTAAPAAFEMHCCNSNGDTFDKNNVFTIYFIRLCVIFVIIVFMYGSNGNVYYKNVSFF